MIKRVSDSYKNHIVSIVLGPFLKIIEAVFDLLIPLFMKAVIDLNQYQDPNNIPNVISSGLASFIRVFNSSGSKFNDLMVGGSIILVMGIVGYIITMFSQYVAAKASVNVSSEVRSSLYKKILMLSKKEREEIGPSKLLTLINSDTYQLQHGVLLFIRLVVRIPVILFGSLIFSFILDWRMGLAFAAMVPLILLVNFLVLRKSAKGYLEIQSDLDNLSNNVSEVASGSKVVRASNTQQFENEKFKEKTTSYRNKSMHINRLNALINPLTFAITSIVLVAIILLLQEDLFDVNDVLIASTIIAGMAYLAQIFFVTVQFSTAVIDVAKGVIAGKRIDSVLKIKPSITSRKRARTGSVKYGEELIKFQHVFFSFTNDDNYFFNDLSFQIRKGETFGIIGGTGSGKTTIVNLIERFYDASKGEISYKGIPIKQYDLKVLRDDIGLVNQKSSLFKGTIKSNYLMSNPHATDREIIEALIQAEAYNFVNKYKEGLDYEVQEGGSNFSGGQRQRLCIGRALVKRPEILILDDSTSALDLLTDRRIRRRLNELKDLTKIIVSQRVATIQNADYIIVLEGGQVVGEGNHKQLLRKCPIYKEIYETQIKKE